MRLGGCHQLGRTGVSVHHRSVVEQQGREGGGGCWSGGDFGRLETNFLSTITLAKEMSKHTCKYTCKYTCTVCIHEEN